MRWLLFIVASVTSFGQSCSTLLVPQTITISNLPVYGPAGGPASTFTINPGPGNSYAQVAPFPAHVFTSNAGGMGASGTGNDTLYSWLSDDGTTAGAGTYTESVNLQITGGPFNGMTCTETVTEIIVARSPSPVFTNLKGIADSALANSSNSDAWVFAAHNAIPASQIGALPGGSPLLPAQGSSRVDPEFGTTLTNCSPPKFNTTYSSISAMNHDDTALRAERSDGAEFIISFPGCVAHQITLSPSSTSAVYWAEDGTNNKMYYFDNAGHVYQFTLNMSTFAISSGPTSVFTFACSGGSCASLTMNGGDTFGVTSDNRIGYQTNMNHSGDTNHPILGILNLNTMTADEIDVSTNFAPAVAGGFNFLGYSECSAISGKRYIWTGVQFAPPYHGPKYSNACAGGSLTFEGMFPISPEAVDVPPYGVTYPNMTCGSACQALGNQGIYTGSHSDTVRDATGRVYWTSAGNVTNPSRTMMTTLDLDAPNATATLASQRGGGLNFAFPISLQGSLPANSTDFGQGCKQSWCVGSTFTADTTSCLVTGATTSGANIAVTISGSCLSGSALVNGDPAFIMGVEGCTIANGAIGSVSLSGSTVTLPGVNCNGTYTASTGLIFKNAYPPNSSFRNEAILMNISAGLVTEARRIGNFLAVPFSDSYTSESYYAHGQCNLSDSLKYVVCNSNNASDGRHVVVMTTGITKGPTILGGARSTRGQVTVH